MPRRQLSFVRHRRRSTNRRQSRLWISASVPRPSRTWLPSTRSWPLTSGRRDTRRKGRETRSWRPELINWRKNWESKLLIHLTSLRWRYELQWGSEYQTSLVLKWTKKGWMPNGLVFECHLNIRLPFEYKTSKSLSFRCFCFSDICC